MKVTVRFAGPFRSLAGRESMALTLPEATLADALSALRDKLPREFADQVLVPILAGSLAPTILLHNREPVRSNLQAVRMSEDDIITFVPPMAGG